MIKDINEFNSKYTDWHSIKNSTWRYVFYFLGKSFREYGWSPVWNPAWDSIYNNVWNSVDTSVYNSTWRDIYD